MNGLVGLGPGRGHPPSEAAAAGRRPSARVALVEAVAAAAAARACRGHSPHLVGLVQLEQSIHIHSSCAAGSTRCRRRRRALASAKRAGRRAPCCRHRAAGALGGGAGAGGGAVGRAAAAGRLALWGGSGGGGGGGRRLQVHRAGGCLWRALEGLELVPAGGAGSRGQSKHTLAGRSGASDSSSKGEGREQQHNTQQRGRGGAPWRHAARHSVGCSLLARCMPVQRSLHVVVGRLGIVHAQLHLQAQTDQRASGGGVSGLAAGCGRRWWGSGSSGSCSRAGRPRACLAQLCRAHSCACCHCCTAAPARRWSGPTAGTKRGWRPGQRRRARKRNAPCPQA